MKVPELVIGGSVERGADAAGEHVGEDQVVGADARGVLVVELEHAPELAGDADRHRQLGAGEQPPVARKSGSLVVRDGLDHCLPGRRRAPVEPPSGGAAPTPRGSAARRSRPPAMGRRNPSSSTCMTTEPAERSFELVDRRAGDRVRVEQRRQFSAIRLALARRAWRAGLPADRLGASVRRPLVVDASSRRGSCRRRPSSVSLLGPAWGHSADAVGDAGCAPADSIAGGRPRRRSPAPRVSCPAGAARTRRRRRGRPGRSSRAALPAERAARRRTRSPAAWPACR